MVAFNEEAKSGCLVLSRREGESVVIADEVEVTVVEVRGNKVRLAFKAPRYIPISRKELLEPVVPHGCQRESSLDLLVGA